MRRNILLLAPIIFLGIIACFRTHQPSSSSQGEAPLTSEKYAQQFAHSYANIQDFYVNHTHLDLTVDFDKQIVKGKATLTAQRVNDSKATHLVLDTHMLAIQSVNGSPHFTIVKGPAPEGEESAGDALLIPVGNNASPITLTIQYETSPSSPSLVWMNENQTESGYPAVFAMNEPTGFRSSVAPGQDTPSVRSHFSTHITIKAGQFYAAHPEKKDPMMALISGGENVKSADPQMVYTGLHTKADAPLPTYLFVFAAGRFVYQKIGTEVGYYADTKEMLAQATRGQHLRVQAYYDALKERLGKDPWGSHDFLILPRKFAYGGMENPNLIFMHPSAVTGEDVSVACHELAHMWTGNIVTNSDWGSFWLNEGFTSFIEFYIANKVHEKTEPHYGDQKFFFKYKADLEGAWKRRNPHSNDTVVQQATQLGKKNLNKASAERWLDFSVYPKGAAFLQTLHSIIGDTHFWSFMRDYLKAFYFKPINTEQFIAFATSQLAQYQPQASAEVTWSRFLEAWIYQPGIAPTELGPQLSSSGEPKCWGCTEAFERLLKLETSKEDFGPWHIAHLRYSINELKGLMASNKPQANAVITDLTQNLSFTDRMGSLAELEADWNILLIQAGKFKDNKETLEKYLLAEGRGKFIQPLYRALRQGEASEQKFAKKVYAKARPTYFSHMQHAIDEILN